MTNPKVQPQARLEIYEGITVETVKQKGSDGQKMMVSLFDQNRDGVLDEREAAYFNSCIWNAVCASTDTNKSKSAK